jgi:hypothetical protein
MTIQLYLIVYIGGFMAGKWYNLAKTNGPHLKHSVLLDIDSPPHSSKIFSALDCLQPTNSSIHIYITTQVFIPLIVLYLTTPDALNWFGNQGAVSLRISKKLMIVCTLSVLVYSQH